jgi:hypothetical protein
VKILKHHLLCGGSSEPSVLTVRSVCLTTPSMALLGSCLGTNVTPEDVHPYPMSAPSVSRSGGRLKGNIKNCDSYS